MDFSSILSGINVSTVVAAMIAAAAVYAALAFASWASKQVANFFSGNDLYADYAYDALKAGRTPLSQSDWQRVNAGADRFGVDGEARFNMLLGAENGKARGH